MADIELVIKIPEEIMEYIKNNGCLSVVYDDEIAKAIDNGTPLPQGHGDLVDRKALMDNGYQMEPVEMWYGIKYAPTIIEADEKEVKKNEIR